MVLQNPGHVGAVFCQLVKHSGEVGCRNGRICAALCEEGIGGRQVFKAHMVGGGGWDDLAHAGGQLADGGFSLVLCLYKHRGHALSVRPLQFVGVDRGSEDVDGGRRLRKARRRGLCSRGDEIDHARRIHARRPRLIGRLGQGPHGDACLI